MLAAFPLLNAFWIPFVAFCVTSSIVYGVFVICSWLPGVRWGKKYAETCIALATETAERGIFDKRHAQSFLVKVETLDQGLNSYNIHCPPILTNNSTSSDLWKNFLIIVGTCAKQRDLRGARKAFD